MPKSTAEVLWRRNFSLKSHSKDCKPRLEPENRGIQVDSLTTTPERSIYLVMFARRSHYLDRHLKALVTCVRHS